MRSGRLRSRTLGSHKSRADPARAAIAVTCARLVLNKGLKLTYNPCIPSRTAAAMAGSNSADARTSITRTTKLKAPANAGNALSNLASAASSGLTITPTREMPGIACLSRSSCFPIGASSPSVQKPVTLPPGRAGFGQPDSRWVLARNHHDRDRARRLLGLQDRCRRSDRNHGGLEVHQLVGERRQCRDVSVGKSEGEGDVGALHIAEVPHPAAKGSDDMHPRGG